MNIEKTNELLFIHPGGLGDVILLEPSLRALKNKLGDSSSIDLLVENRAFNSSKEYYQNNGLLNEIKVFDFKGQQNPFKIFELMRLISGYSTIISSGSSPVVALLLLLSGAHQRIGFNSVLGFLLTNRVLLNKEQYAASMLLDLVKPITGNVDELAKFPLINLPNDVSPVDELSEKRYFLIHPGVSALSNIKRIEKAPGFLFWRELILKLSKKYPKQKIALIAGPDEKKIIVEITKDLKAPNFVDLSSKFFSIEQLACLIKQSECFVCADSAPLHIGVSVDANIVPLFGATDPKKLVPKKKNIKVAKVDNLLCQPCLWNRRSYSCELPLCVRNLEPEMVLDLVGEFD